MTYRNELGQAHTRIEHLEEELRAERAKNAPARAASAKPQTMKIVLFVAFLLLGAGGALAASLFVPTTKPVRVVPVDELVKNESAHVGERLRVQGDVVARQTVRRESPCQTSLVLERNSLRLPVVYPQCVLPDTYRDGAMLVAEGALAPDGTFHAEAVFVRNPYPSLR